MVVWAYLGTRRARTPPDVVIGERWHSRRELLRDIGIAVSAGICEEAVFRGYLQRQLRVAHWRRSVRPGMIAHGWQDLLTGVLVAILLRR